MTILSNGNVGIGTTSPDAKLEVDVASGDGILINSADVATFKMKGGGAANWGFATTNLASGDFGIYKSNASGGDPISAGTPQLYIDSSGDVGIGTTSPKSKLQVDGGIQLADDSDTASASKVGTFRYRTSGNNSYVDMCMQTGATTYAWVNIVQNNW